MKSKESILKQAVNSMNYTNIYRVMTILNWKWASYGRVPTPEECKLEVEKQVKCLLEDEKIKSVECGGFNTSWIYIEGMKVLRVQFVLEEGQIFA